MGLIYRFGFMAALVACSNEQTSFRHRAEKVQPVAEEAEAEADVAPQLSFQSTQADLRPLSKVEIQNSLQDIFLLPAPPELDGFVEQSSKSQIFRNAYGILNDSSSLAGLGRDIGALIESLDLPQISRILVQCSTLENQDCRIAFLERIAADAWRRPLEPGESELLSRQSADLVKLDPAMQSAALSHLLVQIIFDPRFLFRLELGVDATDNPGSYALAAWEKLSAISYNLKQRPPSWDQIKALSSYEAEPERFHKLIDSSLNSSAFAAMLANMISQWLMYYDLDQMDVQGDSVWTKQMARDQLASAGTFIGTALAKEGTLQSLFTEPNPENGGYGVFSSKAFLSASSKHGHGSMILRGVRIIRNALCQNMVAPPGTLNTAPPQGLSPTDPNYDIKLTLQHGARPDCAGCHRLIDPAGLALHGFDGFGAPMNTVVDFTALGIASEVKVGLGGVIESIATGSPKEFAESIGQSTVFARCFSRQALRFVLGRDLAPDEIMTADQLADKHLGPQAQSQASLQHYFRDIMNAQTVYMRKR